MFISIIVVTLLATVFYKKYRHLPIKYILHLSWIATICESIARWMADTYGNNHLIYNIYLILLLTILYKMAYDHTQKDRLKKAILMVSSLVAIAIMTRSFFIPVTTQFMTYMHALGMIALVIILLLYAVDILSRNHNIVIRERLDLFVFSGYLLFGISFIPLSLFLFSEGMFDQIPTAYKIFEAVQTVLLLSMNAIISFGLIWTQPKKVNHIT